VITEEVVANMRSWKQSGFSVDQSVRLEAGDQEGVQRLIQYFLRCPFSQARMIRLRPGRTTAGQVEVTVAPRVKPGIRSAAAHQPRKTDPALRKDHSAAFRLESPHRARHTPATSNKQMPISRRLARLPHGEVPSN